MRFSRKLIVCILTVVMAVTVCGCGGDISSLDILPHLSMTESKHVVAVDGYESFALPEVSATSYRERVELLYNTVVYDGKKPTFRTDDPVKPIYDAAHEFLANYIHDDWTESAREVNTVHAIHDYLISTTDYDFELYRSYQTGNTDFADDPAFYIDGVLMSGKAVCDGLARAFNFLCAMEGIQSVRVTGSFASSLHAWNKVKVGGEWYNVDVTADAVHYTVSGKNYKQISHGFMLICDDTLSSFKPNGHDFVKTPFTAAADYDYYSKEFIEIGGSYYPRVVKSQAELNAIFAAVSAQKGSIGKLELKLDFAGKTQVNSADMYRDEILAAYSKVDNVGFKITDGNTPYFRFPNGVYLFLIYK